MTITINNLNSDTAFADSIEQDRRPDAEVRGYEKPVLIFYGDVRDVTLGPTPGLGESGCEFQRQAGSPLSCP
jgi:hypothetical protein